MYVSIFQITSKKSHFSYLSQPNSMRTNQTVNQTAQTMTATLLKMMLRHLAVNPHKREMMLRKAKLMDQTGTETNQNAISYYMHVFIMYISI